MEAPLVRVKRYGHEMEGRMVSAPSEKPGVINMRFDGHFICGPHDDKGNHIETEKS
jgi:hypothetical protein